MATERRRLVRALAVFPVLLALTVPATAHAASAWWEPLGFAGQRVTSVSALPGGLLVQVGSAAFLSSDGGRTFATLSGSRSRTGGAVAGGTVWQIRAGTVLTGPAGGPVRPDGRAPFLGDAAQLIAAPAAVPGVVVAVGSDNHVWRRASSGSWATSFFLLPAGGLAGIPAVTAIAAFPTPISAAVYLGTAGYGVLISENGGDDWIRADPGLPANVLDLAADSPERALYAATDQGLFVHHLQALPAPPAYHDASLYWRWLGILLVALVASAVAVRGLRRLLPAP